MEELPEANDLPGKAHLLAPKSPNQGYSVSNDNEDAFSSDEEMEGMDYTPQHAAPTQVSIRLTLFSFAFAFLIYFLLISSPSPLLTGYA